MHISDHLISKLHSAKHVVVFTGAGVSAESGIPTFRDALTGLWSNFDAEMLATPQAFERDPSLIWGWYEWRRKLIMRAQPNPAHEAIARLAKLVPRLTLITQNIDDLHERAGSTDIIHLHGSFFSPRCFYCAHPHVFPLGEPDIPDGGQRLEPPHCEKCNRYIRPGVVWFGEPLADDCYARAKQAVRECDLLFSVGTSAVIYPAAVLPFEAAERGATVIQINPATTELDPVATFNLQGPAGVVMGELVTAAWSYVE